VPGVNPPAGIEPEPEKTCLAGRVAPAGEFWATAVGISEGEPIGCPHEEQNKLPAKISAEHDGH